MESCKCACCKTFKTIIFDATTHKASTDKCKMFSKFKLEKSKKVIFKRGAQPYEEEYRSDIVSVPLLANIFVSSVLLEQSLECMMMQSKARIVFK